MNTTKRLYQGSYRTDLEDSTTQTEEPGASDENARDTSPDGLSPEEGSWKKRYGDLRSHTTSLTERNKSLELQLAAAQKKELQIPSTKEELTAFAAKYPDVFRHIRSIAMSELLQERENLVTERKKTEEDLERVKRELGYKRIVSAHPDFDELNLSEKFHEWAQLQPKQIQEWLFENADPDLCIKAIDLFKAETNFKAKQKAPARNTGADNLVNTRVSNPAPGDETGNNRRMWKGSDIAKLHPKQYEKLEAEIEKAREEGRIDLYA